MGLLLDEDLQRVNAVKNILGAVVNGIAACFFLFVAEFDWTAVLLIAVGSALGGQIGANVGRRLPPTTLRAIISSASSRSCSSCCADCNAGTSWEWNAPSRRQPQVTTFLLEWGGWDSNPNW